ncbi:hypothetical protein, partial [Methylocaldum sp.]|uniref:hypothetical protein n=1 Tax=Methylocaldum sp. TaxID=1969727 RepID=UPI003220216F
TVRARGAPPDRLIPDFDAADDLAAPWRQAAQTHFAATEDKQRVSASSCWKPCAGGGSPAPNWLARGVRARG